MFIFFHLIFFRYTTRDYTIVHFYSASYEIKTLPFEKIIKIGMYDNKKILYKK